VFEGRGDRGADARVVVTVDRRPPGADEIDQLAVIRRDKPGAAGGLHEEGRAADGAESAHGRVHAPRDQFPGAGKELLGGIL